MKENLVFQGFKRMVTEEYFHCKFMEYCYLSHETHIAYNIPIHSKITHYLGHLFEMVRNLG